MSYQVINPFIQFVDPINGNPLSAGTVYFGRMDSDPKNQPSNRINVYAVQDNGTEVLLSQPITLNGAGQPQYSGSVKQIKIELYTGELAYSIQVFSKSGAQKGYSARVYGLAQLSDFTALPSIKSLTGYTSGVVVTVKGFYADKAIGGGQFYYDESVNKSLHNGGTIISPEAISAWDGTASDIATLLNWTGSGSGCFVRVYSGKINVVFFGAKGEYNSGTKTGVNDANSWQKCIDVATAAGVEATSEGLKESFISERIFITCAFDGSHTTLYCKGGTIGSGSYAVYIQANKTVGTGALLSNTRISVPQLWNVDKPTTGWSGQCSGLQVNNVDSCMIDTKRGIVFFNTGMSVTSYTPDTAGTAYNDFFLGRIVYNNVNLFLQPVGTGYVNENNFYSGKLGDLTTDRSNTYLAILPPTGLGFGGPNANKFYGLTVEDGGAGTLAVHILLGGPFNMFIGTRFEFIGARGKIVVWRENGNDPTDNLFIGGYSYGDYDVTATSGTPSATNTFKDVGRSPDIDGRFAPIYASVPPGGATPYQRLYESGRNLFTAAVSDTDWTYQLTNGGGLQTKESSSANAEVQIVGGRVYFGTGSSDINASPYIENVNGGAGTPAHNFTAGDGAWNGSHLIMGSYHFWIDATGDFRIKSGAPTSDTDGVVVGTQS